MPKAVIKILFLGIAISWVSMRLIFSQEIPSAANPQATTKEYLDEVVSSTDMADPLQGLKAHLANLLDEYERLKKEYAQVYGELSDLKRKLAQDQQERQQRESKAQEQAKKTEEFQKSAQLLTEDVGRLKQEIVDRKSALEILKKDLFSLEQRQNAAKQQLSILQNEKKGLERDVKLKEFSGLQQEQKGNWETDGLKKDLVKSLKRQQELQQKIEQGKKEAVHFKDNAKILEAENSALKVEVSALERQIDNQRKREMPVPQGQALALNPAAVEDILKKKEEEKQQLLLDIQGLESELGLMSQTVDAFLQGQKEAQALLLEIDRLNNENQQLRGMLK